MIGSLRRRFILGAMAAFGILLLLVEGGIAATGYIQMENSAQRSLEWALDGERPRPAEREPGLNFGYAPGPWLRLGAHYLVEVGADGEIGEVTARGMLESDPDAAREYARQILDSGKSSGKIGPYKYLLRAGEDGSARLAMLDNSASIRMLSGILLAALRIGIAALAALFLILLPVSKRMVRSYAANMERQKQFITNAGHEIKTPAAIILSNLDAMELIQGENRWSRNIRGQIDRLNALLQRMLFMARIDERSVNLPRERVELRALWQAELEPYAERIAERGLKLTVDLGGEIFVRGSREYLQQLAHMLLDNAVQYAREGGAVELRMEKRRGRARIALTNDVDALPDCAPEALFDRFYRGDGARTQTGGGYGIGLSAARAIAEMHRGKITADYLDRAIRFTVELPARG